MSYNDRHYWKTEDGGDFVSQEEAEKAVNNNHLDRTSNGGYLDRETGEEYWFDGTKKS